MSRHRMTTHSQRGAALVIGLILLLVLTLLAVTGMNTATTDLVMAGNEQYRQNAVQAADAGIEQAVSKLGTVSQKRTPEQVTRAIDGSTTDQYTTSSLYMGDDEIVPGFSVNKFVGLHYEITSTGRSARNANAAHSQGAIIIQGNSGKSHQSILTP